MRDLCVIVVGVNAWEEYTLPFLDSLRNHNPKLHVVCVDNGSQPQYPYRPDVHFMRSATVQSYAAGLNMGLKAVPDEGEAFDHWSGGSVDGSKEPIVWLHVEANTKVVAHFAAKVK